MTLDVRRWKCLERHPLSAAYPDLPEDVITRMVAALTRHGVANKRKITLHEGRVLDGWQLYSACLKAGIKPDFQALPKGWAADEFVEAMNDTRRHESEQTLLLRVSKRRGRVAEAREQGKSIRTIAEAEGVSTATVMKDLGQQPPTVSPLTVTGKDGRAQPAARLCESCQRRQRVGQEPVAGCAFCRSKRKPERDAGDDTGRIHKPGDNGRLRSGEMLFQLKQFNEYIGKAMKEVDKIPREFGLKRGDHQTPEQRGVSRKLDEIVKLCEQVAEEVLKWRNQAKKAAKA